MDAKILIRILNKVMKMSVDEDEVTFSILSVRYFNHMAIPYSAEMQDGVRSLGFEEIRVCDHRVSINVEIRVWATPDRLILNLNWRQMLQIVFFGWKSCIIKCVSFGMIFTANKLVERPGTKGDLLKANNVRIKLSNSFF